MIALGDLHGNLNVINQYGFRGCNIMQVGDFGLGFDRKDEQTLDYWNKSWKARDLRIYAIRGNHDDSKWWDGRYKDRWSNIHLVPDYTVLELEGRKLLCVGGARSIDRADRIEAKEGKYSDNLWFPGEDFNYDEDKLLEVLDNHRIDVVVTHSAPNFCFPFTKGGLVNDYMKRDEHLALDIQLERQLLARMYEVMKTKDNKPGKWVYGHFHKNYVEFMEGTKFILVGIGEVSNI